MRRLILVLTLVAVVAVFYRPLADSTTGTGALTLRPPSPAPEESAPSFTHQTLDSDTFEVNDKGMYVVSFLNAGNVGSNQIKPTLSRLTEEFSGSGVRFATVYVGSLPTDAESAPYAVMTDGYGDLSGQYKIKTVPRTFVISDGRVHYVEDGFDDQVTPSNLSTALHEIVTE